jgi:hypothetical protein
LRLEALEVIGFPGVAFLGLDVDRVGAEAHGGEVTPVDQLLGLVANVGDGGAELLQLGDLAFQPGDGARLLALLQLLADGELLALDLLAGHLVGNLHHVPQRHPGAHLHPALLGEAPDHRLRALGDRVRDRRQGLPVQADLPLAQGLEAGEIDRAIVRPAGAQLVVGPDPALQGTASAPQRPGVQRARSPGNVLVRGGRLLEIGERFNPRQEIGREVGGLVRDPAHVLVKLLRLFIDRLEFGMRLGDVKRRVDLRDDPVERAVGVREVGEQIARRWQDGVV